MVKAVTCVAGVVALSGSALGASTFDGDAYISISSGSASWGMAIPDAWKNNTDPDFFAGGGQTWSLSTDIAVFSDGSSVNIGEFDNLTIEAGTTVPGSTNTFNDIAFIVESGTSLTVHNFPFEVTANFNVTAGAAQSAFNIDSGVLNFGPSSGLTGSGSASVTVSQGFVIPNLSTPGADFTATGANNLAYGAFVDGNTATPIASLIGDINLGSGDNSLGTSDSFAGVPIASAANMSSGFDFTLSAFDRAVGTSTFSIVPTPATVGLLGLGGLVAARRRRA